MGKRGGRSPEKWQVTYELEPRESAFSVEKVDLLLLERDFGA